MKKFLSSLTAFLQAASVKAEQQTGRYYNSYFNTCFSIEGALRDDEISNIYIGTEAKDTDHAFISVDGRELDAFKTSLQQARDKYLKWVDIAVDNKVTEMKKRPRHQIPGSHRRLGDRQMAVFVRQPHQHAFCHPRRRQNGRIVVGHSNGIV